MARGTAKAIAASACIALAAASIEEGCVVEAGASMSTSGIAVTGPPPPPMRETRPAPPDAQAVWVAGYWHWSGMQYNWIPGHWENAPPGARWRAPRYSIREGTYFYEPGSWSRP
jgi:WXXGXW repeat (2 copies)